MNEQIHANLIFFDGVCGLCNRSIDFLVRRDRKQHLMFAPLQGETAQRELSPEDISDINTIVLKTPQSLYKRSAAVVRILWLLGGVWSVWGSLLWLIPRPLRDLGYRAISSSRYSLFGKKETCRVPTPEERSRFLP